jgi:hypothetical protein
MEEHRIPVFLSVGTPHLPIQEEFILRLKSQLRSLGFGPQRMGDNQYSYLSPLAAIRKVMESCHGAVIVGMERSHALIGYDRPGSEREREFTHRRQATVWCHLEAGMAYQMGLPLLILREEILHVEGVLDPAVSGYFVHSFDVANAAQEIPIEMSQLISSWGQAVRERLAGDGKAQRRDSLEVFLDLSPGGVEEIEFIESSLERGLRRLRCATEQLSEDARLEFANYEARLMSLLRDTELHGTNETMRSEISRVVYELNRLSLIHIDRTFTDLCIE